MTPNRNRLRFGLFGGALVAVYAIVRLAADIFFQRGA